MRVEHVGMRTVVVVVALLVLALLPASSPAGVPDAPAETCAASIESPMDDVIFLSPCSAQKDCGDGNVVSCTGNVSCTTTIAGVKCDGQETRCPNFCTERIQCECGVFVCWSTSGNCTTFPTSSCDGHELTCDLCPPG